MKPPIPYYGGKTRLAPWIASLLPPHRVYVEPFAGSAAVLFAKAPAPHEFLNDIDGNVVCFFRVLREQPDELERVCRLTPYARDEFLAADLTDEGIDDLERARRFFVRSTQSISAAVREWTSWRSSSRPHSNMGPGVQSVMDRFGPAAERLRTVVIDNRPATKVIELYGQADAVIYADPPYLATTRHLRERRGGKAGDYQHDYQHEDDHRELAAVLTSTPAAVLLSGYPSPLYDELYEGWFRIERMMRRPSTNRLGHQGPSGCEVIWSNRPLQESLLTEVTYG